MLLRNKTITIRIESDLKDRAKEYCRNNGIDLSDLIRMLLIREIKYKPEKEIKYWTGSIEDMPL